MGNSEVVRYEKAIYAKLKMLQAKSEYERAKKELESSLTVTEYEHTVFNHKYSKEVMTRLLFRADIKISPASYVLSQLKYKDISINLHQPLGNLGSISLKNIIKS